MQTQLEDLKEARLYQKRQDGGVICQLCPHLCQIDEGKKGVCQVRENRAGTLYTSVYGRLTRQSVDSVEKKPLYHFYPGSRTYSISSRGCNFRCQYCINWAISQSPDEPASGDDKVNVESVIAAAQSSQCQSIAYTYIEPTIFFEYVDDIARLAHAAGMLNIYKTNGFMSAEMIESCWSYMDAANVDLKAFKESTYHQFGGRLEPVLDSLKLMRARGVWLEITTVVIPNLNDGDAELKDIARFISTELGVDTPWHIARFFPAYKMTDQAPTSVKALVRAREIALNEGLRYVYLGNFPLSGSQDTICVGCGHVLIRRRGFNLLSNDVEYNSCPNCNELIAGVELNNNSSSKSQIQTP